MPTGQKDEKMTNATEILKQGKAISRVEDVFNRWIINGIDAVSKSEGVSLTFVLISCGIDYLTCLNFGERSTKQRYIAFLKEYNWFTDKYSPEDIYQSLRCGLVHNFSIHNKKYVLIHNRTDYHLKITDTGQIVLNFQDFFEDFKRLKKEYFEKVNNDQNKRAKFIKCLKEIGFLGTVSLRVKLK